MKFTFFFLFPILFVLPIVSLVWSTARAELSPDRIDYSLRHLGLEDNRNAFMVEGGFETISEGPNLFTFDFDYQRTISDRLALIWSPLPLGVIYRLAPSDGLESAVSWNLGIAFLGPIALSPEFDSYARKTLTPNVDLEFQLEYGTRIPFDAEPSLWSLGLSTGVRYHLANGFSLTPAVQLVTQDPILQQVYTQDAANPAPRSYFSLAAPLIVGADKQLADGGHIGLEFTYLGFGLGDQYFTLLLNGYWHGTW